MWRNLSSCLLLSCIHGFHYHVSSMHFHINLYPILVVRSLPPPHLLYKEPSPSHFDIQIYTNIQGDIDVHGDCNTHTLCYCYVAGLESHFWRRNLNIKVFCGELLSSSLILSCIHGFHHHVPSMHFHISLDFIFSFID